LFTTAVDIINTLTAAQAVGRLKHELKRHLKSWLKQNILVTISDRKTAVWCSFLHLA
jgi:hypothetical protein